jgi:hypothetical protein
MNFVWSVFRVFLELCNNSTNIYIKIILYTHVGVHCVYELILIYLSAFLVTIIAYDVINFVFFGGGQFMIYDIFNCNWVATRWQ